MSKSWRNVPAYGVAARTRTKSFGCVSSALLILMVTVWTLFVVELTVCVAPVSCVQVLRSGEVQTVKVMPVSVLVRRV